MNSLNLVDNVGRPMWSLLVLEPEELNAISIGHPAIIELDPEDDMVPTVTLACEADSDRLQEVLATGDIDKIMAHLRHDPPTLCDVIQERTRQDYERAVKESPPREQMQRSTIVPAKSINVAPGSTTDLDHPDRICLSMAVHGYPADVCYEITNMANADKLIALLISARNRLWPHGRITL